MLVTLAAVVLRFSVSGVTRKEFRNIFKPIPFMHTCVTNTLQFEYGLRETRVIIDFENTTKLNESVSIRRHCSGYIEEERTSFWKNLCQPGSDLRYKMYVDDSYKFVPTCNGTLVYTEFKVILDSSGQNFDVHPMNPVDLSKPGKVAINFYFEHKQLQNSELPLSIEPVSTDLIILFASFLSFLPVLALFICYRNTVFSVHALNDTTELPFGIWNLVLFSACGLLEIGRLIFITLWASMYGLTGGVVVKCVWFLLAPVAAFQGWLLARLFSRFFDTEFSGIFSLIGQIFFVSPHIICVAWRLCGFLRGYSIIYELCVTVFELLIPFLIGRTVLYYSRVFCSVRSREVWFVLPQFQHFGVSLYWPMPFYGICAGAWMYPVVCNVLDWVWGDKMVDLVLVSSCVVLEAAFASFCGLWRTITRLKNGKYHWHHDHITYQVLGSSVVGLECLLYLVYRRVLSNELYLLDVSSLLEIGVASTGIVLLSFAVSIAGDYVTSFFFVYLTIAKPHAVPELAKS